MHKFVALTVVVGLLPIGHQAIAGPRGHTAQAAASHVAASGFAAKVEARTISNHITVEADGMVSGPTTKSDARAAVEKARSEIELGANAQQEMRFAKSSIRLGKE